VSDMDFTPDEIRRLETRWKSDVDLKLDKLVRFANEYEDLMKMLVQREKERAALRKSVIEKTLAGLIWMAVVGLVSLAWSGARSELSVFMDAIRGAK